MYILLKKNIQSTLFVCIIFSINLYSENINTLPQYVDSALYEYYENLDSEKSLSLLDKILNNASLETKHNIHAETETLLRIMPLGDSITYDNNSFDISNPRPIGKRHGYRNFLWYKLKDALYDVNFVGSRQAGQTVVPSFDVDNDGYPGIKSHELASYVFALLQQNIRDVILLHIGTNDRSTSISGLNSILNEVDKFELTYHHHITIVLASLIDSTDSGRSSIIAGYNVNLKNLAKSRQQQGDDIVLVDMYQGANIDYTKDMADYLHPNDTGYDKMANVWFDAIHDILNPIKHPRMMTDVNGDSMADIVGFGNNGVLVSPSTTHTFSIPSIWVNNFSYNYGWRI